MHICLSVQNLISALQATDFSAVSKEAAELWVERECMSHGLTKEMTIFVKNAVLPTRNSRLKLMVFGNKRHGKDTVCEYLRDKYDISFASSSYTACELFIFDQMKEQYGYKTIDECFDDRDNHRQYWYDAIKQYNLEHGLHALGDIIFQTNSIYCGVRDKDEFYALKDKGYFDLAIWIDSEERLGKPDESYMALSKDDADLVITNNQGCLELYEKLDRIYESFLRPNKP